MVEMPITGYVNQPHLKIGTKAFTIVSNLHVFVFRVLLVLVVLLLLPELQLALRFLV